MVGPNLTFFSGSNITSAGAFRGFTAVTAGSSLSGLIYPSGSGTFSASFQPGTTINGSVTNITGSGVFFLYNFTPIS
jgi:hypothetical protein